MHYLVRRRIRIEFQAEDSDIAIYNFGGAVGSTELDLIDWDGELELQKGKYFLVSVHREENVDRREGLSQLLTAFEMLNKEYKYPVIISTHPRTKKRLGTLGYKDSNKDIRFLKPFGFLDYVKLQMNAACVLSDSGTICEESSILSFPAITVRNSIERPEAMDTGSIVVTGLDPEVIVNSIKLQTSEDITSTAISVPDDYKIDNTSHRVVKLIVGTAKLSHIWDNIRFNDLS